MRKVRTQTGTRISRLGPATETKSDRSEFIVRPVSCKRIKRNIWRSIRSHAGLSSSRSHVNIPEYTMTLAKGIYQMSSSLMLAEDIRLRKSDGVGHIVAPA